MMLRCYFSVSPYVHGNPRIYFSVFFCHVHPPPKKLHIGGSHRKKITCVQSALKKNAHEREFHIAGAIMFDLASNVSYLVNVKNVFPITGALLSK